MNAPSIDSVSWQATSSSDRKWRTWGGQHVLFHRPSGSIHLLNDASLALLTEILVEPRTTSEVVHEFAGDEPTSQAIDQVVSLLVRFDNIGLVTSL